MKKYVVYDWELDDEGGQGVCLANEYTPCFNGLHTEKLGEFDTLGELAHILYSSFTAWYDNFREAVQEARSLFNTL